MDVDAVGVNVEVSGVRGTGGASGAYSNYGGFETPSDDGRMGGGGGSGVTDLNDPSRVRRQDLTLELDEVRYPLTVLNWELLERRRRRLGTNLVTVHLPIEARRKELRRNNLHGNDWGREGSEKRGWGYGRARWEEISVGGVKAVSYGVHGAVGVGSEGKRSG